MDADFLLLLIEKIFSLYYVKNKGCRLCTLFTKKPSKKISFYLVGEKNAIFQGEFWKYAEIDNRFAGECKIYPSTM